MESWQETLKKFNKQQEKCIASFKTSNRISPTMAPATTMVNSPLPAVKFSKDTERLQQINTVRKSTVGLQIKRVIELLFESRQSFTADQINKACYVDIKGNKAVFESLAKNPKVNYDGVCFSYKSKHSVRNQKEVLWLIRACIDGISVADLKDAYPTVMEDIMALKAGHEIWVISNYDSKEDIAYPNDPRIAINVDDELKEVFRSIELPRDMLDIERDLQKNGMKPATNTARRRVMAQNGNVLNKPKSKKKNKIEISKRIKLTNAHLPELFQNLYG